MTSSHSYTYTCALHAFASDALWISLQYFWYLKHETDFLPARRYASAVFATATCLSVCHTPVLCENGAF